MRNAFVQELLQSAQKNSNIMLLTADLGFSVFEEFEAALPKQYLNTGCAEANTMSMAAGLALSGKKVFVYSIVPFVTMRCFEQIRVDVCYHNVDVTIVGVGGGLAYGQLGPTHHAIEDIAILRSLPNMKVVCPADPVSTRQLIKQLIEQGGPSYLRLNRGGDLVLYPEDTHFEWGKAIQVNSGQDLTLITTGAMLQTGLEVVKRMSDYGISVALLDMHTVKPLDTSAILEALENTHGIITLEEHSILGGLGSAVAEIIAEHSKKQYLFKRLGIRDRFTKEVGKQDYLRKINHLNPQDITETLVTLWNEYEQKKHRA